MPVASARARAEQLHALRWGAPDGPCRYAALPRDLRAVATAVDRIGDDLARLRVQLYEDAPASDRIRQVHLVVNALVEQVLPTSPDALRDLRRVWTRGEIDGETFDAHALDAAIAFYALGGEPNVFRFDGERPPHHPAMPDVRALQHVAKALLECGEDLDDPNLMPTPLLEAFVKHHWSNHPEDRGLTNDWELHPLGDACFQAIHAIAHLPAEDAELGFPLDDPQDPVLEDVEPWRPRTPAR